MYDPRLLFGVGLPHRFGSIDRWSVTSSVRKRPFWKRSVCGLGGDVGGVVSGGGGRGGGWGGGG